MVVHYALGNKILVDCGISDINPDHYKVKEESPQIQLIPNQLYRLISMYETHIVVELSYKASMALIAASGGNTSGFLTGHTGRKGISQENAEDDK